MKVKLEINMIDEAYFIIRYKDGPPEEKYEFSLVPKDEEENVLLSMPIELTQTDKNEHICVVEPGDYYLITNGNKISEVKLSPGENCFNVDFSNNKKEFMPPPETFEASNDEPQESKKIDRIPSATSLA